MYHFHTETDARAGAIGAGIALSSLHRTRAYMIFTPIFSAIYSLGNIPLNIPAQVKIREHVRHVYSCRECEKDEYGFPIVKTPVDEPVIKGSFASPEAIAHIMAQKFVMGAPLYRQVLCALHVSPTEPVYRILPQSWACAFLDKSL